METLSHSADSLYSFIKNARQIERLDSQIKSKEKELKYLEQLEEIYEHLGCNSAPLSTANRYTKTALQLVQLRLERNKIERQILEFELGVLIED